MLEYVLVVMSAFGADSSTALASQTSPFFGVVALLFGLTPPAA